MRTITIICWFLIINTTYSQNVGIGTSAPEARLQINHSSSAAPGLLLKDSSLTGGGLLRFQNLNYSKYISLNGFAGNNSAAGTFLDISSDSVFIATFRGNGNVGIGKLTPQERLDIDGHLNITGTIKTDGVTGQEGQVLTTNNSGTMSWRDPYEYKNFLTFYYSAAGVQLWTVPAGVTKILIEAWGGGAPGTNVGGGGGGAYLKAILAVVPGNNVQVNVGNAGSGATDGQASTVTYGTVVLTANGGIRPNASRPGIGGDFSATGLTSPSYTGLVGEPGKPTTMKFEQITSTEFVQAYYFGDGGNGANAVGTAGYGGFRNLNISTALVYTNTSATSGTRPGGGGGAWTSAQPGGTGMVIIRY